MSYEPSPDAISGCTTHHAPRTTKTTGGSSTNALDVGEVFTEKEITENDLKEKNWGSLVVKRNEYVENVITKLRTEYARVVEERKSFVERCVTDLKEEMDALSEFNKEKVGALSEFKKEDFDVTSCILDRYMWYMRVLDAEENQFWN